MVLVISLGGSVFVKDAVDTDYVKRFASLIDSVEEQCILVIGGGNTARAYQKIGRELDIDETSLDWLGIRSTHLNAELVRGCMHVSDTVYLEPAILHHKEHIVAGGWKPGRSTDDVAVQFAVLNQAKRVINITNQNYIYDKDPREYEDAQPLKEATWKQVRQIVGSNWSPGLNMPFDPVAAKRAEEELIEVDIINGNDLTNLNNCFLGKKFEGSIIR